MLLNEIYVGLTPCPCLTI